MPTTRAFLCLAFFASLFALAAADLHAGDDKKAKKKTVAGKDHLDFKKTYADALLESRIRNVPVFVSRHKDF